MGCLLNIKFVLSLAVFCQVLNNGMGAPTASTGRYYWVRCKPNVVDTNCRTERGPLMNLSQQLGLPDRLPASFVENIEAEKEEEQQAAAQEEEYRNEEEEEPVEGDGNQNLEEDRELEEQEEEQEKEQEQEQGELGEEKGEEEEEEGEVQAVGKLSLFVDPEEGSAMAADGSADGPGSDRQLMQDLGYGPGSDRQLNQNLGYWFPVEEETAPPAEELKEDHLLL